MQNNRGKYGLWIIFLSYSAVLLYWMFWGFGRSAIVTFQELRYNGIPFNTIMHFTNTFSPSNWRTPIINLAGNIGVFIPLGYFLPALFNLRRFMKFTWAFASIIVVLELLQMVLHVGTADIDDLILNVIGGWMGLAVWRMAGEGRTRTAG